jgi:integration host factor subunit beta
MMIMKAFLAKEIRKTTGLSYQIAVQCIDILLKTVSDALAKGDHIELRGFGSFSVSKQAARKTGIAAVPEHGKVLFKPCDRLRRAVWEYKGQKA